MTNKHLRIGAILLGASAFLPIGAIAAPIAIETVLVSDAGNTADRITENTPTGFGAVNYNYYIGKYEVTVAQYVAFLNAVGGVVVETYNLYDSNMALGGYGTGCGIIKNGTSSDSYYTIETGWANKPVNWVSFWSAARFCNWLTTNGTDTEHGIYELNGVTGNDTVGITRNEAVFQNGSGVAIASPDEWYKAAYYNGNGTYRDEPTVGTLSEYLANYNYSFHGEFSDNPYLADVNYYDEREGAKSYYGTFQQGGNVDEWIDAYYLLSGDSYYYHTVWGGDYYGNSDGRMLLASDQSLFNQGVYASFTYHPLGFRITSLAMIVPEPQTYALFGGMALLGLTILRRRKK